MLSDIEIARNARPRPITDIAASLGYSPEDIEPYGKFKAKVPLHPRHGNEPHPSRRGQDHRQHRACGRDAQAGRKCVPRSARTLARSRVRHQGRRVRRRICAGHPHGGHQPALHGRLPRRHVRQQPAFRPWGWAAPSTASPARTASSSRRRARSWRCCASPHLLVTSNAVWAT